MDNPYIFWPLVVILVALAIRFGLPLLVFLGSLVVIAGIFAVAGAIDLWSFMVRKGRTLFTPAPLITNLKTGVRA